MSLATQVLVGLGLGIAVGVFFGELVAPLQVMGDIFIRLLQMTVIPYVAFSLVSGIGRLEPRQAAKLALRAGAVLLLVWGATLLLVFLMPLAFPTLESASFFSSALVEERPPFDFLGLYIPSNPFHSLAESIVPAVVFFSVALGVALMHSEKKELVIAPVELVAEALLKIASFVAKLAPYGVFAIAASAAGTLAVADLERLRVYLVSYAALALILTFCVLPGFITTLTPLRYRDVIGRTRDALVTAFAVGNLLIVLPLLANRSRELVRGTARDADTAESAVEVIVPASFNFPSCGKLLTLAFIPFGAWFMGTSLSAAKMPAFFVTGLFSFFGQTVTAIPFLLDLFKLPADLLQLFLTIDVFTSRFGVMLAAMHVITLSLIGSFAMTQGFTLRWKPLGQLVLLSVGLTAATLLGIRFVFSVVFPIQSDSYERFVEMDLSRPGVAAKLVRETPPVPNRPAKSRRSRIAQIRERGVLRVCYFADSLPFAFVNDSARLVGFDVEMAHGLARKLDATLEFNRIPLVDLTQHLSGGTCDIAMSGTAITTQRAEEVDFSAPYLTAAMGFIVEDHLRDEFASWQTIRKLGRIRIGMPRVDFYADVVSELAPDAEIVPLDSVRDFFRGERELNALVYSAEAGSGWTQIYPAYNVVVPLPDPIEVPLAYPMPKGERDWVRFVDTWIELKRRDKTTQQLFRHWILGEAARSREPRWSVIRDVLGWVE